MDMEAKTNSNKMSIPDEGKYEAPGEKEFRKKNPGNEFKPFDPDRYISMGNKESEPEELLKWNGNHIRSIFGFIADGRKSWWNLTYLFGN